MTDPTTPDYADLGAAAPLPVGAKAAAKPKPGSEPKQDKSTATGGSGSGGSKQGPRGPRLGPVRMAALVVVLVVALAMVPALSNALVKTPRDRVGITYGGGPFEAVQFQEVIPPGSGLTINGLFDSMYLYPSDQLVFAIPQSEPDQQDHLPSITAPSNDDVEVRFDLSVHYKLNTDKLQSFHEEIGLRYEAFTDDGWTRMLNAVIVPQLRNALQEQARNHSVSDLYGDAELLVELQREVQSGLNAQLRVATGDDYFCNPTFTPGGECGAPAVVIKAIKVPDAVQSAFERNRVAALDIEARRSEADAVALLMEALGDSGDVYALLKAIESGAVQFWVLPDGGVTVAGPTTPGNSDRAPGQTEAPADTEGG